jgi:hypothetical protein
LNILVDTSVWIDYFRSGKETSILDTLIEENVISTNNLILTELIPFLRVKNQKLLISLLNKMRNYEMRIDWEEIMKFQTICLKNGMNGVGIPDLIIAQNSIQNNSPLFSFDKHFMKISSKIHLPLFNEKSL